MKPRNRTVTRRITHRVAKAVQGCLSKLAKALGARFSPMSDTTAPVTTGGIIHSMNLVPHLFTIKPMTKKTAPATKMPASAEGMPPFCLRHEHGGDEGEAASQVARQPQPLATANRDQQEDQRADTREEDRRVGREADQHRAR